jgi:RNA polymerase sigma factor (sigma-70 family)
MLNPFKDDRKEEEIDSSLVSSAVKGNRKDLETLIRRHQDWIYNIAVRMVWDHQDAEDVTQEVLIKIVTTLSTFQGRSSFRTWAYRIVANHVINMRRRNAEKRFISFTEYGKSIERTPDGALPDQANVPVDLSLVVEETKIHCMMAMLLCLDRRQRFTFILGEIFGVSDRVASEILDIRKTTYRQRLSRARRQVYQFMREKCGLVDADNPCHCDRKTKALIDAGHVDPENLLFNTNFIHRVRIVSEERYHRLNDYLDSRCQMLFREHPFQSSPDFIRTLHDILRSKEFQDIFDFNGTHEH